MKLFRRKIFNHQPPSGGFLLSAIYEKHLPLQGR